MKQKIVLGIIFLMIISTVNAATWVNNPINCPDSYLGQQCSSAGEVMCGLDGDILQCYASASLNAPISAATSTTSYSGSLGGGYILDCEYYDGTLPHCDNGGSFWCNRDSSCFNVNRQTTCTASVWEAFSCGNCISGYTYCDGSFVDGDGCEVNIGVTPYPGESNAHYDAACNPECNAGYLDCNGDLGSSGNGCEILNGGACTTGGLPGTYQGCTCIAGKQLFETGTNAQYATTDPLLWGTQHGAGVLMHLANQAGDTFEIDNSGCIIFPDASLQCTSGGGSSLWTQNVNDIYYDTGNVGVGVLTPGNEFEVNGSLKATNEIIGSDSLLGVNLGSLIIGPSSVGSVVRGQAITDASIEVSATGAAHGSLAAGQAESNGIIRVESGSYGSIARGWASNGEIRTDNSGSTAQGAASEGGRILTGSGAVSHGAAARGHAETSGTIYALYSGATATGYAQNLGTIYANGYGSLAKGYANGGTIESNVGATAMGYANLPGSQLLADASGSFVSGFVHNGGNININTGSDGSVALGLAQDGGLIQIGNSYASRGSFASGFAASGEEITINGGNSNFAFGTNSKVLDSQYSMALMGGEVNNADYAFAFGPTTVTSDNTFGVGGDITATGTICDSTGCIGSGGSSLWTQNVNDIYYDTGNVGIDTTTPEWKFAVDNGTGAQTVARIGSDNPLYFMQGAPQIDFNLYSDGTDTYFGKGSLGEYGGILHFSAWNGKFGIFTTDSGNEDEIATTTERFSILSDGRVGIGTTTPAEALDVVGNIVASGTICDGTGCIGSGADTDWTEASGNVYRETGNVGIGTTTPTSKLHVIGNDGPVNSPTPDAPLALNVIGGVGGYTALEQGGKGGNIQLTGGAGATTANTAGDGGDIILSGGTGGVAMASQGNGGDVIIDGGAGSTGQPEDEGNILLGSQRGNVGIGTTTPTTKLDILGEAKITPPAGLGSIEFTGDNGMYNHITSTASDGFTIEGPDQTEIWFNVQEPGELSLVASSPGGKVRVFPNLIASSNVGIGTANPSYHLDIYGDNGEVGQFAVRDNNGEELITTTGELRSDAIIKIGDVSGGSGETVLGIEPDSAKAYLINGQFGIGTTAPNAKLNIMGDAGAFASPAPIGLNIITGKGGAGDMTGNAFGGRIYITTGDGGDATSIGSPGGNINIITGDGGIAAGGAGSGGAGGDFIINLGSGGAGGPNGRAGYFIVDGGNVGIGTDTPTEDLHVLGTAMFDINEAYNGFRIYSTAAGENLIRVDGDANYVILGEYGYTNVGIGTTTPQSKLEVSDPTSPALTFYLRDNIATPDILGNITFKSGDAANPNKIGAMIIAQTDQVWGKGGTANEAPTSLKFFTQSDHFTDTLSSPRMVIDSDGNVGIGTTTPGAPLEVSTPDARIVVARSDGGNSIIQLIKDVSGIPDGEQIGFVSFKFRNSVGESQWASRVSGIVEDTTDGTEDGSLRFEVANDGEPLYPMYIKNTGNVGIGTDIPTSPLTVQKSNVEKKLFLQNVGIPNVGDKNYLGFGHYNSFVDYNHGGIGSIFETGSQVGLYFDVSSNFLAGTQEAMRISGNGNVGIGTSSPATELEVHSKATASDVFDIYNTLGNRIIQFREGGGGNSVIGYYDSDGTTKYAHFQSGNSWLDVNNFGVGTSTPTYKLDVNGDTQIQDQLYMPNIQNMGGDYLCWNGGQITRSTVQCPGGPASPFFQLYKNGKLIEEIEFSVNLDDPSKAGWQSFNLENWDLSNFDVKIKNKKPETDYIDTVQVVLFGTFVDEKNGALEYYVLEPSDQELKSQDGSIITLEEGEEISLEFESIPDGFIVYSASFRNYGHYVPNV